MKARSEFASHMMFRFAHLESYIHNNAEGLQSVHRYFKAFHSNLADFRKKLSKSLSHLKVFLRLNKKADVTLYAALKFLAESEEALHKDLDHACGEYKKLVSTFKRHVDAYVSTSRTKLAVGQEISEKVKEKRKKVLKAKEKYHEKVNGFYCSGVAESEQPSQKVKGIEEAKLDYQELIKHCNKFMSNETEKFLSQLETIEKNEEMRITMIAESVQQGLSIAARLLDKSKQHHEKTLNSLKQVSPARDIELYAVTLMRVSRSNVFDKMVFEDHGKIYQLINRLRSEEDMERTPKLTLESDNGADRKREKELSEKYASLLKGKNLTESDKQIAKESLKTRLGRLSFASILNGITEQVVISDSAAFETLSELMRQLLAFTYSKKDLNPVLFHASLNAAFLVSARGENCSVVPLRANLKRPVIFDDCEQWVAAVQYGLEKEFKQLRIELIGKDRRRGSDSDKEVSMMRSKLFSELCSVAMRMALLHVPKRLGQEVLLGFASYYDLAAEKIYQMLIEYDGAQKLNRRRYLKAEDITTIANMKRAKLLSKHRNHAIISLAKSLPYIQSLLIFRNILLLSKAVHKQLRSRVYKKVLALPAIPMKLRLDIWKKAIADNTLIYQYSDIKKYRLHNFSDTKKTTEDAICIDILRSFRHAGEEGQEVVLEHK